MVLSSFYSNDRKRKADIVKNDKGYTVRLYTLGVSSDYILEEVRDVTDHSILYAQDCAENYISGIFDVDKLIKLN
jgi:hypothetical protein